MLTQILTELTAGRIARKADKRTKERAESLPSRLVGLSGNVLTFITNRWVQKVQLLRLRDQLDRVRDRRKRLDFAV
jgi:hypothetical protein